MTEHINKTIISPLNQPSPIKVAWRAWRDSVTQKKEREAFAATPLGQKAEQDNRFFSNLLKWGEFKKYRYRQNIAYLSIPKVACGSLQIAMLDKALPPNVRVHDWDYNRTRNYLEICDRFIFTFVRNPYDRLVSCYTNKFLGDEEFLFHAYDMDVEDSFEIFAKKVATIPDYIAQEHFKSQYAFIYRNGQPEADFIGHFESLETQFAPLQEKYGLNNLTHDNKSQRKDWREYYTIELAQLVYRRYRKDFDLWYPTARRELINYLQKAQKKNKSKSESDFII